MTNCERVLHIRGPRIVFGAEGAVAGAAGREGNGRWA